MKGIAIYIEGGGDTHQLQAELRLGFDALLSRQKDAARTKRLHWRVICAGGREQTFRAFLNGIQKAPTEINVLLVDAEEPCALGPVHPDRGSENRARLDHLRQRDGWSFAGIEGNLVHLMVRVMEAWIVADPAALGKYYKQGFNERLLPMRSNLEEEPKASLFSSLANATRPTAKGEYSKRRHAADILHLLDTGKIAQRCPRFGVLTACLDEFIATAA